MLFGNRRGDRGTFPAIFLVRDLGSHGIHQVCIAANSPEHFLDPFEACDRQRELAPHGGIGTRMASRELAGRHGQGGERNTPALAQAFHQHLPTASNSLTSADDLIHRDEYVAPENRSVHERNLQGHVPSSDLDPRRVRRHQCQRDPPVGRPSQQAVRIVQAESQADQRRDRRQGDVAFLPVEADAQNGFSILLPLADHAGVLEGPRVRPGAWPGQAETGRLLPSGKPGEVMILLFLRAVAQQQLARTERVGNHDRNRSRDASAGDFHDHFGMSKRRETQAAVLFRQHHSEKLLLPDQPPGFRREVVVGRRDAPNRPAARTGAPRALRETPVPPW